MSSDGEMAVSLREMIGQNWPTASDTYDLAQLESYLDASELYFRYFLDSSVGRYGEGSIEQVLELSVPGKIFDLQHDDIEYPIEGLGDEARSFLEDELGWEELIGPLEDWVDNNPEALLEASNEELNPQNNNHNDHDHKMGL